MPDRFVRVMATTSCAGLRSSHPCLSESNVQYDRTLDGFKSKRHDKYDEASVENFRQVELKQPWTTRVA